MCIPMLINLGYSKEFSASIVAAGGGIGLIIPPSLGYVMYGSLTGTSVAALFTAGFIPGLVIAGCLIAYCIVYCSKNGEDREKILAMGRDLDRATKAQVVVVTMTSLGSDSIENYANRLFRKWGIGDRTKNNGVLLLIAKEDRKFRIEVGYGLEGAITDGYAGSVLDGMKSDFRSGKYSPAIVAAYGKLTQKGAPPPL